MRRALMTRALAVLLCTLSSVAAPAFAADEAPASAPTSPVSPVTPVTPLTPVTSATPVPAAPATTEAVPPPPPPPLATPTPIPTPQPAAPAGPRVLLKTNLGEIVLELNPDKAPKSSANFMRYVKSGFYNGTVFHRVMPNFMVQGGGFNKDMVQKQTLAPIQNEGQNGLSNDLYTVAMARTNEPHSATAQFFINVNNNAFLNYPGRDGFGYAVFGKVVSGTEVVDKIRTVPTSVRGQHHNVPVEPVIVESAKLLP